MSKRIPKNIQQISPYIPGKPIEELQREKGLTRIVKLASNENPNGPSPKAVEAIKQNLYQLHRYPDASSYLLRESLSKVHKINIDWIVAGNGTTELIQFIAIGLLGKNYSAIISEGSFIMYPSAVMTASGKLKKVQMVNRTHNLSAMADAIDKTTRLIYVANPNNPTGTWNTINEFEDFLKRVPKDVIIVLDEAYFEYVTASDYPNGLNYVSTYPNLFVLRTFSKIHGLAGLRVGYGICSDQEIIGVINKIRSPFNISNLAQSAAMAAIYDEEHIKNSIAQNTNQREYLTNELKKRGFIVTPSQTNFVLVDPPQPFNANQLNQELLNRGVIVRPMAGLWGFPQSLRITIGTPEENQYLLKALDEILNKGN